MTEKSTIAIEARIAALPQVPHSGRYTVKLKKKILDAVREDPQLLEVVKKRYTLSDDELTLWRESVAHHGDEGLKPTKLHELNPSRRLRGPGRRRMNTGWGDPKPRTFPGPKNKKRA